jgi:hypothetical protein
MEMTRMLRTMWKLFKSGGWAPTAVLGTHIFLVRVLHLYIRFPAADMPMHFSGGLAIAYFISRCFRLLPRDGVRRSRVVVLELVLIVSLTAAAAVFWEFAEFLVDRVLGTNLQVSLANTMRDMAMGISGALAFAMIRSRQLRVRLDEVREVAGDWVRGIAD